MKKESIENQVKEIIRHKLGLNALPGNEETLEKLGAGTIDKIEIEMMIEEELGIYPSENQWEEVKTVDDIIELILKESL